MYHSSRRSAPKKTVRTFKALVILLLAFQERVVDSEVNNVVFDRFKVFLSSGIVFEY